MFNETVKKIRAKFTAGTIAEDDVQVLKDIIEKERGTVKKFDLEQATRLLATIKSGRTTQRLSEPFKFVIDPADQNEESLNNEESVENAAGPGPIDVGPGPIDAGLDTAATPPNPLLTTQNLVRIADRKNEEITLSKDEVETKTLILHNLTNCRIVCPDTPVDSARMRDVNQCVIINLRVESAALVESVASSIVEIVSSQLRLEGCKNTLFFCATLSPPIIERSDNIVFTEYAKGVDDKHIFRPQIEDLNWRHRDHSPHWRIADLSSEAPDLDPSAGVWGGAKTVPERCPESRKFLLSLNFGCE